MFFRGTRCFRCTGTPRRICRMRTSEFARSFVKQARLRRKLTSSSSAEPAEIDLAKRVCQFAEIVPQVLNGFRPNILANYLFELANSFHAFYEACPVLKSEEPARSSRLALCDLTARVLQRGSGSSRDQSARADVRKRRTNANIEHRTPKADSGFRRWTLGVGRWTFSSCCEKGASTHPHLHLPITV